jgi:hypothetical protein
VDFEKGNGGLHRLFFIRRGLIQPIADAYSDPTDRASNWTIGDDVATISIRAIYSIYAQYERFGTLPRDGGWLAQPLDLLVQIDAIKNTVEAYRLKTSEKMDALSATQAEIIRWLEN